MEAQRKNLIALKNLIAVLGCERGKIDFTTSRVQPPVPLTRDGCGFIVGRRVA